MKKEKEEIKFQDETLELFIKTITKIIQKVVKDELKGFEKHYTEDVLEPALLALRADLESKINSPITTTSTE